MKKEQFFSLNDFKKWMANQKDRPGSKSRELIGLQVESKISAKKLLTRIVVENGDIHELAKDFRHYGGVIVNADKEDNLTVEVDSGTFVIPKLFVRKVKS